MKIPACPNHLHDLMTQSGSKFAQRLTELFLIDIGKDREKEYLHWDQLQYKPLPAGINNHAEWWALIKFRRRNLYRLLPLLNKQSEAFCYWVPDALQARLHQIDKQAAGQIGVNEQVSNPNQRDRYLVNSLIEEAITSSQLEGASTLHKVAKDMLREGRKALDKSEQMIINNYQVMSMIRELASEDMTPELLLRMHQVVTRNTLTETSAEGRLRKVDEAVGVYDNRDNSLLHDPPVADELPQRLISLCDFANRNNSEAEFIHPVVHAIVLHFMLAYDHPFADGNGRTARALFYWAMKRHGYWLMEYVSISTVLKQAPARYSRAYLYSETDGGDLTYFIDYKLTVIVRAIEQLRVYLEKKSAEVQRLEQMMSGSLWVKSLNHRQLALLTHAIRNPGHWYSIQSHKSSHRVSYPTARADLLGLVELGVMQQKTVKKEFLFRAKQQLESLLSRGS